MNTDKFSVLFAACAVYGLHHTVLMKTKQIHLVYLRTVLVSFNFVEKVALVKDILINKELYFYLKYMYIFVITARVYIGTYRASRGSNR